MPTLFISDLHLSEAEPRITHTFFYFLEHIANTADALYILGDFFESYIGDDESPFIKSIIHALSRASDAGLPIYLMHGNRDFLIGKKFAERARITLIPDPTLIMPYGKSILLMHGDSLCTNDKNYQRFRKIARNRWVQKLFMKLPLSFRQKIAGDLRKESTKQTHHKSLEIMDVCTDTVISDMKKYGVMRLIHGHTHRPAIHRLPHDAERIVLDAWHQHGQYLQLQNNGEMISINLPH